MQDGGGLGEYNRAWSRAKRLMEGCSTAVSRKDVFFSLHFAKAVQ